jgi:hypothetical protein
MRIAITTAILGTLLAAAPIGQTSGSARTSDSLERPFAQDGKIRMDLSAGDYEIVGRQDDRIRLEWSVKDSEALSRVRATADVRGSEASVSASSPSNKNFKVRVEVPERSHLVVRLTAGDIRIEGVRGNKDVELHAGDMSIDVGSAADYNTVDASSWAGDIHAEPFGVDKGGLFRSFDWKGTGPFHLHTKLKAGDIRLYSKAAL